MQARRAPKQLMEVLLELEKAFPNRPVDPRDNINEIMHNAGAQAVLRWIATHIDREGTTGVSAPERHELPNHSEAVLRAAFGGTQ